MKKMNCYWAKSEFPLIFSGFYIKLEKISPQDFAERRAILQVLVSKLIRKGFDSAIMPLQFSEEYDIAILNVSTDSLDIFEKELQKYAPIFTKITKIDQQVISNAWQNRARMHFLQKGFIKVGMDRYVLKKEMLTRNRFKSAWRLQTTILNHCPAIYLDPGTRIINPITDEMVKTANEQGIESEIKVRVLPDWKLGLLQGQHDFKAGEREYPLGEVPYKGPLYWKIKHGIDFVTPADQMLKIYIPAYKRTPEYPRTCVFSEFERGSSLPHNLKMCPEERVSRTLELLQVINPLPFVGRKIELEGPVALQHLGYREYPYPSGTNFSVVIGGNTRVPINKIQASLKEKGPLSGPINGKYIVFYPEEIPLNEAKKGLTQIENAYESLKFGVFRAYDGVGENGFIQVGHDIIDYTSAISEIRTEIGEKGINLIAIIILPSHFASAIYYGARGKSFEKIFDLMPLKAQAIRSATIQNLQYYPAMNLASQCYVKLGGTGFAVWVLDQSADAIIPGIEPGSSCYTCYDVSRRRTLKSAATVYSALTDSYGRFITTGMKPAGGEKLTPLTFYDILTNMLEKIAIFNRRFKQLDQIRKFEFKRLVFAKDGKITADEAEMMRDVIIHGILEEGRIPIDQYLAKIPMLTKNLVIDIIGVNKTPNRRLYEFNGQYLNLNEGMAVAKDAREGLLVAASTPFGTIQPLEITLHHHLCLNTEVAIPHIAHIMQEYYSLTKLDWASLFRQGKFALPQILTQHLGENITAGVLVPDDMVLL